MGWPSLGLAQTEGPAPARAQRARPSGGAPVTPPAMHPANGALRFALELGALTAMGWWGFEQTQEPSRYALMLGVPAVAATSWGVFAVPNDPSRGGSPVIAVPGLARLAIELAVFGFATWAIADLGNDPLALSFGGATTLHYAISYDRVLWLLRQ